MEPQQPPRKNKLMIQFLAILATLVAATLIAIKRKDLTPVSEYGSEYENLKQDIETASQSDMNDLYKEVMNFKRINQSENGKIAGKSLSLIYHERHKELNRDKYLMN